MDRRDAFAGRVAGERDDGESLTPSRTSAGRSSTRHWTGYESPEHPLVGVNRHFRAVEAIQRAFPDLALVGTGYSYLQEFLPQAAAANVRDGRVSIARGRACVSLATRLGAATARSPASSTAKRVCRTFSYCTALMRTKQHPMGQFPTGCPPFDKDAYGEIWKEAQLHLKK